jgi:hypothetical protein
VILAHKVLQVLIQLCLVRKDLQELPVLQVLIQLFQDLLAHKEKQEKQAI